MDFRHPNHGRFSRTDLTALHNAEAPASEGFWPVAGTIALAGTATVSVSADGVLDTKPLYGAATVSISSNSKLNSTFKGNAALSLASEGTLDTNPSPLQGSATLSISGVGILTIEGTFVGTATVSVSAGGRLIYRNERLHSSFYSSALYSLHQVSYNLGDLSSRLHYVSWTSEAHRLHTIFYESVSAATTSALAYHVVSYEGSGISPLIAGYRLHEILYSVVGADTVSSANHYHEINYTVIGADSLTSASTLHTVLYEGSGVSSIILDQRLHEISYSVIGTNPITSSSNFHQVYYTVFTPSIKFNEVFYKSVIINDRLHLSRWLVDTSQYRIHEARYHVVDTSSITEIGTITFSDSNSNTYDFLALTITADEDSPYWQCEVSLKDAQNYILFQRDTPFIINLLGTDFYFIVDSRTLQRTIDDAGNYQEVCTISGLSPLVRYASPRATKITKTWEIPTLASAIVNELIGSVTWNLVDWMIPAYRLAADHAAPLDIVRQIVEAVGGLIESQPSGSVICRHRWPTSIAELATASVDHTFDERFIFSASEEPTQDELIDKVRIYDTEAGFQDRLEYVPNKIGTVDDPRNGVLYAFPSPWREGLRMVTTRPSTIHVGGTMTEGTRAIVSGSETYPPELLTFTERTSSTQYPIMSLTNLDWLDEDLGAAIFTPYATTLEAGSGSYGGYSLAEVQYVTRYLAVPVTCLEDVEEIEAQFLLLEETQDG